MISTHVLDTVRGRPASGVPIKLESRNEDGNWMAIGLGITDADGRTGRILPDDFRLVRGRYRLTFDTGAYFGLLGVEGFYPEVVVHFEIRDPSQHYHVPLLLSHFGYSTYRGS